MKISCCNEIADAITDAYRSVIEGKLQEYLAETGLHLRGKYMSVGVWAADILHQMSLFMRVARQVKEWEADYKGENQISWDIFKSQIIPMLDYTENEDDEQKYDLFCEILYYIYNSLTKEGYTVVGACSR